MENKMIGEKVAAEWKTAWPDLIWDVWGVWSGTWLSLPGECIPGIVHDTVKVIDFSQRVHLPRLHLQKVILLSYERKKRKAKLKYEAESHCATLCMYVCQRWISTLKYLLYNEARTPRNTWFIRNLQAEDEHINHWCFFLVLPS